MFYYRVHISPPLVPVMSHMNSVHIFSPYFPYALSYIIYDWVL